MLNDVVITGIGVVYGQALSPAELFEQLSRKRSAIRNHPGLAAGGLPNPACAYIDDAVWKRLSDEQQAPAPLPVGPQARLALHASGQALRQSGVDLRASARAGIFVASNKYTCTAEDVLGLAPHYDAAADRFDHDGYLAETAHRPEQFFDKRQDMAALAISQAHGGRHMVMTSGDACAAGGMAIGNGYRHIRHGLLDVALVGATEAMCNYIPMIGFGVLGALCQEHSDSPEELSRPFDRDRSGFIMGEGSAFLVLESLQHAMRRGAPVLARVSGFARHAEAWRITASPSDGSEYARCIRAALQDAQLAPEDIDHVNAHGTSTKQNDSCEALAIKAAFGPRSPTLPVTSNKSALGHSLAASGAVEAVLSVLSLQHQVLLPTLNFHEGDASTCGLDIVRDTREARMRHVISHSFGFGGENCALVFSTFE